MATGFGIALHDAGLPVGPDRCERLARAVTIMGATTVAELRACALATMVSDPGQMPTFDRVFAAVFGGPSPFRHLNLPNAARSYERPASDGSPQPQGRSEDNPGDLPSGLRVSDAVPAAADSDEPLVEGPAVHRVASATERLSGRDFTELSPAELRQLVTLMREMALAIPPRRTRRFRTARDGKRPDLRRTLRLARGAVVLIISDGWETGDPTQLGAQMARLSRVAHRIVWANPRTQSPRYRPEVGGMAAAWPYCDAVVSAHNLDSLDDLLSALRDR